MTTPHPAPPEAQTEMPRCGDHVLHRPTGETWVVAWADGDDLAWAGWPNGVARLSDCEIVFRCSDERHLRDVAEWAVLGESCRRNRVLRLYGAAIAAAQVQP